MFHLFKLGDFILHSGDRSYFKIDCDALTADDWICLAKMVHEKCKPFRKVIGVPKGGLKLEKALELYCFPNSEYSTLIVDDVLTTGTSMEVMRETLNEPCKGAVIFARGKCPDWVAPIFQMQGE